MLTTEKKTIPCRKAFTETLFTLAKKDKDILVVTSDARGSVTLNHFAEELPRQFIEVGIAEQNAVGLGAGLASCGKKVFVCGPACFYSARSLEQMKVDVAYTGNPVKIIGVSGGVSYGALGSTHHSLHDIAVTRAIPNLSVILPSDHVQTEAITRQLVDYPYPVYMRLGRAAVPRVHGDNSGPFTIGKAYLAREGHDISLVATGETVYHAMEAAMILENKGIQARVLDMHTIKPFDEQAVLEAAMKTKALVTIEEHSVHGGLGAAVSELVSQNHPVPTKIIGIPDEYAIHGSSPEIFTHYGLTAANISNEAIKLL